MTVRQNAHLTFKANAEAGRHGWLRLTPAYSHKLVAEALSEVDDGAFVLDPFGGSGTTGLLAGQMGFNAALVDINPFLVWFATTKTRNYTPTQLATTLERLDEMASAAEDFIDERLWQPDIHNIDRWWSPPRLQALSALRALVDQYEDDAARDLLEVGLCRTLIKVSNAAFNHQSMSFKDQNDTPTLFGRSNAGEFGGVIQNFVSEVTHVVSGARQDVPGEVEVHLGEARDLAVSLERDSVDVLYTSPPYANRMSYIRELRPYMYWTRYLEEARDAGELDWQAIGGTWGIATSRVGEWEPDQVIPLNGELTSTTEAIAETDKRNAPLLANYVYKYFVDMWEHFQSAAVVLRSGGQATYIIGNSTFYGTMVPSQDWYARLLAEAGFADVTVKTIRKRNSKKELFEYAVSGRLN